MWQILKDIFGLLIQPSRTSWGTPGRCCSRHPLLNSFTLMTKQQPKKRWHNRRAGEPVAYFENRYRCKDGSYKWLAWTAVPASKNGHIYAVARDITKQKAIQHELEAQRELFNNVLSNVPASIFWKDRNSVYLGVNKRFARDTGLQSPEETHRKVRLRPGLDQGRGGFLQGVRPPGDGRRRSNAEYRGITTAGRWQDRSIS